MPRPPSESNRVLRFLVDHDHMYYPDHLDGRDRDLVVRVSVTGPILETDLADYPGARGKAISREPSVETLEFLSSTPISLTDLRGILDDLANRKTVTLGMAMNHFESHWTGDHGFDDLYLDFTAQLSLDEHSRLTCDGTFEDDWPLAFGLELFKKRLDQETAVSHCEERFWQLLTHISTDLVKALRTKVNTAATNITFPSLDAYRAPYGEWKVIGPLNLPARDPRNRRHLLHALGKDDTVFSKENLRMIFGKEDPDEFDGETGHNVYTAAKDVTVNKLIKQSGVKPVIAGKFAAKDVRTVLIPYAMMRPRAQQRYKDLTEELVDLGIEIPPVPLVQHEGAELKADKNPKTVSKAPTGSQLKKAAKSRPS